MSMVRFAEICDRCSAKSEEYTRWHDCRECGDDVCDTCMVPHSGDDETGKALCLKCDAELAGVA